MYVGGLSRVSAFLLKYNNAGCKTCCIRSTVCYEEKITKRYISLTQQSLKNEETLEIGGVSRKLTDSKHIELIPSKYGKFNVTSLCNSMRIYNDFLLF